MSPGRWISELVAVWRQTKLIVLTAQVAAIYAAILIPFKVGIPIIPGFVELRPANAIPLVTSLLFGPVAAWGAGIGNIIGDCFGTLGPASVFGFLGNFFLGLLPYTLWGALGPLSSGTAPHVKAWRPGLEYALICCLASGGCAVIIAWGVEWLGFLPFMVLAPAIFFNNVAMGLFLGPPLLWFLYPRVKQWGLLYPDLLDGQRDMADPAMVRSQSIVRSGASGLTVPDSSLIAELNDITFQYQSSETPALKNLTLTIRRGEWVAIMGRRGSGKSTVCHLLSDLIPRSVPGRLSGHIRTTFEPVSNHDPSGYQRKGVGLVFQDFDAQLLASSVEREVLFPLEYLSPSLSPDEMKERIQWALREVGLEGFSSRDPLSLSGGQRQRLVLATVLVCYPSLLVLDQPLTDLDPQARVQLKELFRILRDQGMTIVLVGQESAEVLQADRLCVLDHGEICWTGTPREFFGSPTLPAQFGIAAIPLAECFVDMNVPMLPVTVEEAWRVMDEQACTLHPKRETSQGYQPNVADCAVAGQDIPLLQVDAVSFEYSGESRVLEDISFIVTQGEFVAVLGKNGSGKSTLSKLLNGLLLPLKGEVFVGGRSTKTTSMSELSRLVGYVFQNPDHQIFAETVWQEVEFGVKNFGFPRSECEQRVADALEAVGLDVDYYRSQDPFSLTKGERQRIAVASILATKPDILIFDEPTTGLDAQEIEQMMNMIFFLHQQGHTILMITHMIHLVATYSTRCILMHEGRVIADDTTRAVFSNPSHLHRASLEVPALTTFSQRWGCTLLTVDEIKAAMEAS
ncbi:MAG: energy-coupling factor transporter ATPase [Nitrospirales bacterium]|nr:ATP-binding cassette domain-containing protein [Nitrospira sp.]MDR4501541.1 energy-coupling factor transporter ATPase [Nitrospirales bacterium]